MPVSKFQKFFFLVAAFSKLLHVQSLKQRTRYVVCCWLPLDTLSSVFSYGISGLGRFVGGRLALDPFDTGDPAPLQSILHTAILKILPLIYPQDDMNSFCAYAFGLTGPGGHSTIAIISEGFAWLCKICMVLPVRFDFGFWDWVCS